MVDAVQRAAAAQDHARFFDHLVELIPAKFYHAGDEERVDMHSMKKAAKLAIKQTFKAKAKEAKRAKLDPDAPGTALEVQQERAVEAAAVETQHARHPQANLGAANLSREELQARLHAKLEVGLREE
jgi:hypothetical protein